ncbi:MAG: hypothetical protein KAT66_00575 [Candidatus Lokiarchaeota archaeon]|nr:hypothetical protein [Candidatus Lokiarchaeota archaeon]
MRKERVITIREIAKGLEWKDVKRSIKYYYPKDRNDYESLFEAIKKYRKRKSKYSKEVIEIDVYNQANVDKIHSIEADIEESYYYIGTNLYSMSFRLWRELANIPISKETLEHYLYKEILAHFIWEITFWGTEKKSRKIAKDMQKKVIEIKKEENNK